MVNSHLSKLIVGTVFFLDVVLSEIGDRIGIVHPPGGSGGRGEVMM